MCNISARDLANDRIPRQVRFWDGDNYCTGIMVGKLLICGCCGGTFDLDEVIDALITYDTAEKLKGTEQ